MLTQSVNISTINQRKSGSKRGNNFSTGERLRRIGKFPPAIH